MPAWAASQRFALRVAPSIQMGCRKATNTQRFRGYWELRYHVTEPQRRKQVLGLRSPATCRHSLLRRARRTVHTKRNKVQPQFRSAPAVLMASPSLAAHSQLRRDIPVQRVCQRASQGNLPVRVPLTRWRSKPLRGYVLRSCEGLPVTGVGRAIAEWSTIKGAEVEVWNHAWSMSNSANLNSGHSLACIRCGLQRL
jgi:hypothetical protein